MWVCPHMRSSPFPPVAGSGPPRQGFSQLILASTSGNLKIKRSQGGQKIET